MQSAKEKAVHRKFSAADRGLYSIFYMMGLSIGVHLLGLLHIQHIVMVYYFRRYNLRRWEHSFLCDRCIVTGIVAVVSSVGLSRSRRLDIMFVNGNSAHTLLWWVAALFTLLGALLLLGLRFPDKRYNSFTLFHPGYLPFFTFLFARSGLRRQLPILIRGLGILIGSAISTEKHFCFLKIAIWSTVFLIVRFSTYFHHPLIRSMQSLG